MGGGWRRRGLEEEAGPEWAGLEGRGLEGGAWRGGAGRPQRKHQFCLGGLGLRGAPIGLSASSFVK